jgi:hypothetical protein
MYGTKLMTNVQVNTIALGTTANRRRNDTASGSRKET